MTDTAAVPRVDASDLSYDEFCKQYMGPNRPVLITNIGADWPIYQTWRQGDNGDVNVAFLRAHFGDAVVPVVGYGKTEGYGGEDRGTMTLDAYLALLESGKAEAKQQYMKDWHFTRDFPETAAYTYVDRTPWHYSCQFIPACRTPIFFQDDWLNWWWDQPTTPTRDDYRFVYLGPAGSTTPLHHDVLLSYSWSINICGRKEWLLFPPTETWKLWDRSGRCTATNATEFDATQFPHLATAHHVRVVQGVGEALFVPSGWYHQVQNLDRDTLSVNHNWFNAYSLEQVCIAIDGASSGRRGVNRFGRCGHSCSMSSPPWSARSAIAGTRSTRTTNGSTTVKWFSAPISA
ncbi:hypothetical protein, variant 2 [Aphanomyces invadans]|uniref:JmjC domain-containing protein n=1 Tax=Aphanomyces invadans TaxID=157072 RepID=A0A024TED7_9STRA|nr:hypothetical protein, variant 2 [Aphanomyces invadans]XP_008878942.1 hypothetical protein, variant 1 [Aphanomyces invadans]ETV92387.1 hypothetical protein, variant 1 [Aphanomyces invadans]ETV92388.1 hypothetical protein, variant 2 [Aphanomyces invadans]|eukprot:XP_008878938.1 hypothetical protein, variant 2 [Aphanomyces invadans]